MLDWLREADEPLVNLDKLTYAGNLASLASVMNDPRHNFVHGDIADADLVCDLLRTHRPSAIFHLAAESHVDRSLVGPEPFIQTNVVGTARLLEATRGFWATLGSDERDRFRFINVSTDEVFGSLRPDEPPFTEIRPYAPNSPYSASKAAADHLCRSYFRSYGLPIVTTNCSNNYGPFQFPEKLIPLMIRHAEQKKPLPVYGDGRQIRDWLYVGDHCRALRRILEDGVPGETYNIGGDAEMTNMDVVTAICDVLDDRVPASGSHRDLITSVADRPGHDRRYAIDASKLRDTLGWEPEETFATGLERTVEWYLGNEDWIAEVESGEYRNWLDVNYAQRAESA